MGLHYEEILSETMDFIKAMELDKDKFLNPKLREKGERSVIHTTFLKDLEHFFLELVEETDLASLKREFKISAHPFKGWKMVDGEEQYVELTEEERLKFPKSEYKADLIVRDGSDNIIFHIEVDSKIREDTVPVKFNIIPSKHRIWVSLQTGVKKSSTAIRRFNTRVGWLKEEVQGKKIICVLRHPEIEPIIEKI